MERVLIVDDDPFFSSFAASLAASNAISLDQCNDTQHLDPRALGNYDTILLDIMMPGIDARGC